MRLSFCSPAAPKTAAAAASDRDGSNGAALLPALRAKKIGNIFVHLRKIAQHPMLVRSAYTDATLQEMAAIAHSR